MTGNHNKPHTLLQGVQLFQLELVTVATELHQLRYVSYGRLAARAAAADGGDGDDIVQPIVITNNPAACTLKSYLGRARNHN
jgi:hypothetical protein